MKNKCVNGKLDGLEFKVSTSSDRVGYNGLGYYIKSALREGKDKITLWVWCNKDEEPPHPVNPG